MNIGDLIGEATAYDKKEAVEERRPKSWCKSVSAFANGDGGVLIFGMENDGTAVGLAEPEKDAEKISEIIKARLDPIPEFSLRFETVEGKVLVILDIRGGNDTPYYYSADGVLETFIRVGNESVKATATEQKRLILKGRNTTWDTQLSAYNVRDFAFTKLRERFKKWTRKSFEERDLLSFGLVNETGVLTNAGALLADECPMRWSRIFCTRWNGLDKSGGIFDALDDAEYSGGLIYLLENGENFILRNCRKMWRKTPNSREEMPDYVERSYHEALINALVHRDNLIIGSEIHIDIFDDRLEIYSPGGMPDGIAIQDRDPLSVPSTRRNPLVADVFERLGFMERRGSGFGKIIRSYEFQANYQEGKKPYFRSDRTQFTVILPNLNYGVILADGYTASQDHFHQIMGNNCVLFSQKEQNGTQGGTQNGGQGVTQGDVTQGDVTQGDVTQGDVTQGDVTQGGTQGGGQSGTQSGTQGEFQEQVLQIIRRNREITAQRISEITGVPLRTLRRRISKMPNVRYVGSGYSGHWEIIEE